MAVTLERWQDDPLNLQMRVTKPDGETMMAQAEINGDSATVELLIPDPQLWWPNGYGEQPLYRVDILLANATQLKDERTFQIGLRTIELRQEADEWGKSFTFVINGVPIFAKGANWIPADSFPTRFSDEQLEHLIRSTAVSHQNMLRVWGWRLLRRRTLLRPVR